LRITGTVAEAAAALGIRSWHVSLSHDGGIATALVVAES
jgi:holo-[acyl-carrier protein] synthase